MTHKQRAIDGFVAKRADLQAQAESSPGHALLAAGSRVLMGASTIAFSVFGGLKLGFPWYVSASGGFVGLVILAPNLMRAAVGYVLGALRDVIAAKRSTEGTPHE